MSKIIKFIVKDFGFLMAISLMLCISCRKDLEPFDSKSSGTALSDFNDIQFATIGNYSFLVTEDYTRNFLTSFQWASDNVVQSGADGDQASLSFSYQHIPNEYPTTNFWSVSYKMINGANEIINRIKDGESTELNQIKGENLFLRAMAYFNLVRLFGRPFIQDPDNNLGVPIVTGIEDDEFPSRNTVLEVFKFVISDLRKAESLMTIPKNANFASKEASEALLSRVYLYEGDYDSTIYFTNKVIDSHRFSLASRETFGKSPTLDPENNPEVIFNFRHTPADNKDKNAVGSLYFNDPVTGSSGWGEYYASLDYIDLLNKYPDDIRHSFITPHIIDGEMQYRGVAPQYYINKYNYQEGIVNLSSPTYLRLAEMYLNRAEAYSKIGENKKAIDDVNLIRERAGIPEGGLYSIDDLLGHNNVFDVVLEERRLEFAFEGLRRDDLFRNNLPLIRTAPALYPQDSHFKPGFDGHEYYFIVEPDDPRVVYFIPERETLVNKNLKQNP